MPAQRTSKAFRDISATFQVNPLNLDLVSLRNENAIARSVRNLILTIPGERPFNTSIGSAVNELLFEPMDELIGDALQDEIASTINKFEPRVSLINTLIEPDYEAGSYGVTVNYRIVGLPLVESVSFVLQRPQ